jgi:hypothetical protein
MISQAGRQNESIDNRLSKNQQRRAPPTLLLTKQPLTVDGFCSLHKLALNH